MNLGHTFGHAIETEQGYGVWLHGEAVSAGIMVALRLSQLLGKIDDDVVVRTKSFLSAFDLPVSVPATMSAERFIELMAVDKKVLDGRLRLVLLNALGDAVITSATPEAKVREAIALSQ